ncbi:SDR family NAD(P)-dependent oxidoreductase [Maribellus comscasis]|uniref:SDR family NAD(P)-dependent oxidoreductase n=1 Tax=Maribellus comscasis TaxID=2681766 RepID=A0A6I6JL52_9BACT|nr:SDR family NAD(P)-dependent oxidoreductase [Maribellus comscasis]QGY43585.1 SDR family NAD(P)-dependent oxidoreductase [Maribellus comscasis]
MEKTALITGASKRVGKALTEHLASNGWNVVIHYNRSEKAAQELADSLKQKFPKQFFEIVKANLFEIEEVEGLISKVVTEYGRFHLLINNASVFDPGDIEETDVKLFDTQMSVNLKAPFFLTRDFARVCREGNIINFVDTRITSNKSNFSAYSLSKKTLWELTKMAALEFAPEIRVNAIAPGVTLAPEDKDEKYLQKMAGKIPMKKPGGMLPVLQSLDYIIQNEHLTGQLLFADGGENLGQKA